MERRYNGKKLNFKHIYAQVAKYGKLISELAIEHNMDEDAFIARMKMGLDPKLFSDAIKSDARNRKNREAAANKHFVNKKQEEKNMARKNEKVLEQKFREQQSAKDRSKQQEKINTKRTNDISENTLESLKSRMMAFASNISKCERALATANEILVICEGTVLEKQNIFDEAKKALEEAISNRDSAKSDVDNFSDELEHLKNQLADTEHNIKELKDKYIYLVAPGFSGNIPEFGTFFSTIPVAGFTNLQITEATTEYAIEPELKDMVVTGYDSYKEYMEGLRFVMLCAEYTCTGKEYSVLVSDNRIQKLIESHIGASK